MDERWHSLTEAALLLAAIFVVVAIGIAIVRRFRGGTADDVQESSEMMSKFRDLHDEGGLSDEEFRTIKTKLATKLKRELNESNETNGSPGAGATSTKG